MTKDSIIQVLPFLFFSYQKQVWNVLFAKKNPNDVSIKHLRDQWYACPVNAQFVRIHALKANISNKTNSAFQEHKSHLNKKTDSPIIYVDSIM